MMRRIKMLIGAALVALASATSATVAAQGTGSVDCFGELFNPASDPDWNNLFPISIGSMHFGPNSNPPLMRMPAMRLCPSAYFFPVPCIGITYWEPQFLAETARIPGCLSSLGGIKVMEHLQNLERSAGASQSHGTGRQEKRQIHWYEYPVMAVLDLFTTFACANPSGVNLAWMSEVDPIWNMGSSWSMALFPETTLFANPIADAACAVDAVASNIGFPLDSMIWCMGNWGTVFPPSGYTTSSNAQWQVNGQSLGKYMAYASRLGLLFHTIGPMAECSSYPGASLLKSQYRFNHVWPINRKGKPQYMGASPYGLFPPQTNYATHESSHFLIWQGKQCCLRFFATP